MTIIGMSDFLDGAGRDAACWLCQKPVSIRALFCAHCQTIQPVRDLDPFTRLGLDRQFDLDTDLLENRYEALVQELDSARFLVRGTGERGHIARQRDAVQQAYELLRDPLARGRCWLALNRKETPPAKGMVSPPFGHDLRRELAEAADAPQCDRIAWRAGQALEQGLMRLMQALRAESWTQAQERLAEIDEIQAVLEEARARRPDFVAPHAVPVS